MRIGFLGSGSMASAIAVGAANASDAGADFLFTSASGTSAVALAERVGGRAASSNEELARECDLLVLGVKPQYQAQVIAEIRDIVIARQIPVLSIAAGQTLEAMAAFFGADVPLVRAMPNIAALVNQSMTALCASDSTTSEQREAAQWLMSAVGRTQWIPESQFPVFTALAGSSPAWVFEMIDAFGRSGVKYGMTKAQAVECAAAAFLGAAQMLLSEAEKGAIPAELIDRVTSPGGTTIAGLLALEEAGLPTALHHAVDAAVGREHLLG